MDVATLSSLNSLPSSDRRDNSWITCVKAQLFRNSSTSLPNRSLPPERERINCNRRSLSSGITHRFCAINADIFGWIEDGKRWWEDHRLALRSPLPRACRYESEPFWVNQHGYFTRWRNSYLDEMEMHDFKKRSLCNAARSSSTWF